MTRPAHSASSAASYRLSGAGPAVLLLHGIPTSGRLWDYVVSTLNKTHTCIAVDLPGLGESPLLLDGILDPGRYAEELEILRQTLNIPLWDIVGHDAGSAIAVHYASRYPKRLRRLVLCSPPIFPDLQIPWFVRLLRTPLLGDLLAPVVNLILWRLGIYLSVKRRDRLTPEILASFRQPFRGHRGAKHLARIVRWGDPTQVLAKTAALLPAIAAPTLVVHGVRDGAVPPSFAMRAAALIPRGGAHLLDCGHFLPLDCPEALCKLLLPFLQEDPSSEGS